MPKPTQSQMWDALMQSHDSALKAEYMSGYGVGYEKGYNKAIDDLTKIMGFETLLEEPKKKKK